MLRNYLLIAWRNMFKNKAYTAINVVGLALSMSVCLLLILLIYDHFQFDTFHPHAAQTFRIQTQRTGSSGTFSDGYATSPLKFGQELQANFPAVTAYTNLNIGSRSHSSEVRSPFKILESKALCADASFFKVFGFELLSGHPAKVLEEPNSIVLMEEFAAKLFPNSDPLGALVEYGDWGSFKVTGIVKTPPAKSHIQFEVLISMATLPNLVADGHFKESYDSWENTWINYNYLVLSDPGQQEALTAAINAMGQEKIKLKPDEPGYTFTLHNIRSIVPGNIVSNEISFALPMFVLFFFAGLAFIVMLTASINYTNLSIARSLSRVREIGIRKANGASRRQIISQFLVESIVMALISLIVAIGIYWILLRQFNEMWIFNEIGVTLKDTTMAYGLFVVFTILIGLVTGLGPSYFISGLNTIQSLKGSIQTPRKNRSKWQFWSGKKILLGIQFGFSFFMLISIFLVQDQANLLTNAASGFEDEQVYFVDLQNNDPELVKQVYSQIPGVEKIGLTSHHPGVGISYGNGYGQTKEEEPMTIYHFSVDENYLEVMGIKLLAGSNFPHTTNSDQEEFIILNELATQRLGFENPEDAIGQIIFQDKKNQLVIQGVVADYHWEPLMMDINPMALRVLPENYQLAYLQLSPGTTYPFDKVAREKWTDLDEQRVFSGGFLTKKMDEFYIFFFDLGGILAFISLIAVSVTLLGFLGLVSYHLQTHVKEMGIRKVLGASFGQISYSMSRGFLSVIAMAMLLATPLSVVVNGLWINQMSKHAPLSFSNVGPAVLIILVLSIGCLLAQVWASSQHNPVDSLRSE